MSGASDVIGTLQASANCGGNCSCCTELENQINSLNERMRSLELQARAFESNLKVLENLIRDGLKSLGDTISGIASSIDRKLDALERSLLEAIAALRDFLLGLFSGKNSALEARIAELERRLGNFGVQLQDLQALVSLLQSTIAQVERRVVSVESQISSILSSILNLNSSIESLQAQINSLGTRIDGLQRSIDSAIAILRSEITQLNNQLSEKINSLQKYLEKLIADVTIYATSIATRLEREISALRDAISTEIQNLREYINSQIEALIDLIYSLLGNNSSDYDDSTLKRRIDAVETAISNISSKLTYLEYLILKLQQTVSSHASQIAEILKRLNNLSSGTTTVSQDTAVLNQILSALSSLSNKVSSLDPTAKLNQIIGIVNVNTGLINSVATKFEVNINGSLIQSDCKNGSNNITSAYSGSGFIGLSRQISSLNQVLSGKLCTLPSSTDSTEQKTANKKVTQIYRILGGDTWFDSADQIKIRHDPEKQLRESGTIHYDGDGKKSEDVESISILSYLQNMLAPQYYRAGYHELPGEVPETLLSIGSDKDRIIKNALDLQQWQVEQFDALIGQFPIEIEIKDSDPLKAGDQTKKIEIANISEALAELVGLSFLQSQNSDLTINYLNRLGVETIATKNASLITQDYAKANASYLGYEANPVKREIIYALNPAGQSIETILSDTKGYIVGWGNAEKASVADYLKRIFFTVGIIKESNFIRPNNLGRLVDSLNMVKTQETEESSAKLTNDIATMNDQNSTFNAVRKQDTSIPESQVKVKKKT